ncbi:hypothetical protein ACHWQZ_G010809 [Mnemiopsis leidyi]
MSSNYGNSGGTRALTSQWACTADPGSDVSFLTHVTSWVRRCGPDDYPCCSYEQHLYALPPPVKGPFMDISPTLNLFLRWTVNTMLPHHRDAGSTEGDGATGKPEEKGAQEANQAFLLGQPRNFSGGTKPSSSAGQTKPNFRDISKTNWETYEEGLAELMNGKPGEFSIIDSIKKLIKAAECFEETVMEAYNSATELTFISSKNNSATELSYNSATELTNISSKNSGTLKAGYEKQTPEIHIEKDARL